jgi:hypothetical protein
MYPAALDFHGCVRRREIEIDVNPADLELLLELYAFCGQEL